MKITIQAYYLALKSETPNTAPAAYLAALGRHALGDPWVDPLGTLPVALLRQPQWLQPAGTKPVCVSV